MLVVGVIDPALGADEAAAAARAMVRAGADAIEVGDPARAAALRPAVDVPVVAPGELPGVIADDAAALAVADVRGARVVRTADVHAARRVADILAAVRAAAPSTPGP